MQVVWRGGKKKRRARKRDAPISTVVSAGGSGSSPSRSGLLVRITWVRPDEFKAVADNERSRLFDKSITNTAGSRFWNVASLLEGASKY